MTFAALALTTPRAASAAGGGAGDSLVVWIPVAFASAFREMAHACDDSLGGLAVELVPANSEEIRERLDHGAAADVVVMADSSVLGSMARSGKTGPPRAFANGRIALIAGGSDASLDLISYLSLTKPGLKIASATPATCLGRYTDILFMRMQTIRRDAPKLVPAIRVNLTQDQPDSRAVLGRVIDGKAGAGVVFAADVDEASSRTRVLNMPEFIGPRAPSVAAAVRSSRHRDAAEAFLRCLSGPNGKDVLQRRGIQP